MTPIWKCGSAKQWALTGARSTNLRRRRALRPAVARQPAAMPGLHSLLRMYIWKFSPAFRAGVEQWGACGRHFRRGCLSDQCCAAQQLRGTELWLRPHYRSRRFQRTENFEESNMTERSRRSTPDRSSRLPRISILLYALAVPTGLAAEDVT